MTHFNHLYQQLAELDLPEWQQTLQPVIEPALYQNSHGKREKWLSLIDNLPDIQPPNINLNQSPIQFGEKSDLDSPQWQQLKYSLQQLMPWRKGPIEIFGHYIDCEWRSDWKWHRIQPFLPPLKNKLILDIGAGNGYYCLRMAGEKAGLALGIDPILLYSMQFLAMKKYTASTPAHILPIGIERLPRNVNEFDLVFSMGVFYHRKSPIEHLFECHHRLKPGGQLILETLVIDGDEGQVLVPGDRYANMRNVWFLPTTQTLESWLKRCKFQSIKVIDETVTSLNEQRSTEWMTFQSLKDNLDPNDQSKTIEGYPAPKRVVIIASST
jgi:tRNA (mo5U34)-methyltransferase